MWDTVAAAPFGKIGVLFMIYLSICFFEVMLGKTKFEDRLVFFPKEHISQKSYAKVSPSHNFKGRV